MQEKFPSSCRKIVLHEEGKLSFVKEDNGGKGDGMKDTAKKLVFGAFLRIINTDLRFHSEEKAYLCNRFVRHSFSFYHLTNNRNSLF